MLEHGVRPQSNDGGGNGNQPAKGGIGERRMKVPLKKAARRSDEGPDFGESTISEVMRIHK